jgi:hypothetical protein
MGVNFIQYCILGWEFTRDDIEQEISPAEYQLQDRFDTKTGKVTHQENVLVKAREYKLAAAGVEADDIYDLAEGIADKYGLECGIDSDYDRFWIGFKMGETEDYGRVDLINGSVCLDDFAMSLNTLRELQADIAPDQAIELHFGSHVG